MVNSVQPPCILRFFEDLLSIADVHQAAVALRWSLRNSTTRGLPSLRVCLRRRRRGSWSLKVGGETKRRKIGEKYKRGHKHYIFSIYVLCPRNQERVLRTFWREQLAVLLFFSMHCIKEIANAKALRLHYPDCEDDPLQHQIIGGSFSSVAEVK